MAGSAVQHAQGRPVLAKRMSVMQPVYGLFRLLFPGAARIIRLPRSRHVSGARSPRILGLPR